MGRRLQVAANAMKAKDVSAAGRLTDGAVDANGFAVGSPHTDLNNWRRDCRMRWLYEGGRCIDHSDNAKYNHEGITQPLGVFDDPATQGASVSVSDTPCTAAGCPGGTVCKYITMQNRQWVGEQWATGWAKPRGHTIDCGGAVGRFVRVHLPGSGRIFAGQVSVNRKTVTSDDPNQLVCYAVEGRISTTTTPEYVTTDDPEDPVYYSTCYVRGPILSWLPPQIPTSVPPIKWNLGENMCLDCDSYRAVQRERDVPNGISSPLWTVVNPCTDCDSPHHLSTLVKGSGLVTCGVSDSGGSGGAIAAVVILLMLVGLYVYYRMKHDLPLRPWLDLTSSYNVNKLRSSTSDTAAICESESEASNSDPPPVPSRPAPVRPQPPLATPPSRPTSPSSPGTNVPPPRPDTQPKKKGDTVPLIDTTDPPRLEEPTGPARSPPPRPTPPTSSVKKVKKIPPPPPPRPIALPKKERAELYKAFATDSVPTISVIRPPPMEEPAKKVTRPRPRPRPRPTHGTT